MGVILKRADDGRNFFAETGFIYVPLSENNYCWVLPEECVWNAAQELTTKYVLKLIYEAHLSEHGIDIAHSGYFFTNILRIPDCTWEVYVDELKALKESDCDDFDSINDIYTALDSLRPQIIGTSKDKLR